MGGRLRPTLADEIHVTGVSGVVATKLVAFVTAATVAAIVVHRVTGEALGPAPVRARPLLAPVAVAYVIPASSRGRRLAVGRALL